MTLIYFFLHSTDSNGGTTGQLGSFVGSKHKRKIFRDSVKLVRAVSRD